MALYPAPVSFRTSRPRRAAGDEVDVGPVCNLCLISGAAREAAPLFERISRTVIGSRPEVSAIFLRGQGWPFFDN